MLVQDRAISLKILKHTVSKITTLPKNHFSYILALLSYKQNFLTQLSCHYFSFFGTLCFCHAKTIALFYKRSSSCKLYKESLVRGGALKTGLDFLEIYGGGGAVGKLLASLLGCGFEYPYLYKVRCYILVPGS